MTQDKKNPNTQERESSPILEYESIQKDNLREEPRSSSRARSLISYLPETLMFAGSTLGVSSLVYELHQSPSPLHDLGHYVNGIYQMAGWGLAGIVSAALSKPFIRRINSDDL